MSESGQWTSRITFRLAKVLLFAVRVERRCDTGHAHHRLVRFIPIGGIRPVLIETSGSSRKF